MSEQFLDTNVPGNPAYHFTIQPPVREGGAGWLHRPELVPGAGLATQCVHGGVQPDPAYGAVMPPLPNATLGAVMPPVPSATAAGDVPAFPAVNTSLMPPPAPNPDFSFGPPIISLPAGFPIPPPAPGGAARP